MGIDFKEIEKFNTDKKKYGKSIVESMGIKPEFDINRERDLLLYMYIKLVSDIKKQTNILEIRKLIYNHEIMFGEQNADVK